MATRAPANKLEARFCQQLSNALRLHRVVLVFDPDEQLQQLFTELSRSDPTEESPGEIDLLELQARSNQLILGIGVDSVEAGMGHGR